MTGSSKIVTDTIKLGMLLDAIKRAGVEAQVDRAVDEKLDEMPEDPAGATVFLAGIVKSLGYEDEVIAKLASP